MMLKSKEHYDLMDQFENELQHGKGLILSGLRFDREDKSLWTQGRVYQHGETNNLFLAYRLGYAFGLTKGVY